MIIMMLMFFTFIIHAVLLTLKVGDDKKVGRESAS